MSSLTELQFHPDVEIDIQDSFSWYESKSPGLGLRFLSEIEFALERIVVSPLEFPKIKAQIRRCLVRKFPFAILFTLDGQDIFILTIMHTKRRPGFWADRLST